MIRMTCPSCRAALVLPDRLAGTAYTCATCGADVQVPGSPPPVARATPEYRAPAPARPRGSGDLNRVVTLAVAVPVLILSLLLLSVLRTPPRRVAKPPDPAVQAAVEQLTTTLSNELSRSIPDSGVASRWCGATLNPAVVLPPSAEAQAAAVASRILQRYLAAVPAGTAVYVHVMSEGGREIATVNGRAAASAAGR